MSDDDFPEPDRTSGAPHPRFSTQIFGHARAHATCLEALAGDMHHAWLLTGPAGIGKASFAWALAGTLLATPPSGGLFGAAPVSHLGLDPEHPVRTRLEALSEPRLSLIRRGYDDKAKRLKTQITVDEVRKLHGFLGLSAPDGGRRVVLIDAADDMNVTAANAVLKLLEEPPADTVFLLISHRPGGLLPTIKSRCRTLRFDPLGADDLVAVLARAGVDVPPQGRDTLIALADGSAGRAVQLLEQDGLALYAALTDVVATCPTLDRAAALKLANATAGRGAEAQRDLTLRLFETLLARMARTGVGAPPAHFASPAEEALCLRLAATPAAGRAWADAAETLPAKARRAVSVNLDASGVILDMILKVNDTAGRLARP
ncbi:MAG: DNA polymerase III subunit delta' [Pseudomonadota bacterium]